METYSIFYELEGQEDVIKQIQAENINAAMAKASDPVMWPNDWHKDYERMTILIYNERNAKILRHYDACTGKSLI